MIGEGKILTESSSSCPSTMSSRKSVPVSRQQRLNFPGIDPRKITVGVELEMILLNMPAQTGCHEFIGAALKPLAKALGTHCLLPSSSIRSAVVRSNYFQVKEDCTIFPENIMDTSVEVATPILKGNDWNWVIPQMCQAITTAAEKSGATIAFNYSTGLHVHIAVGGRAYTLPEVKRVAKAIVLFEKYMDELHPKCRNLKNSFTNSNRGCAPLQGLSDTEALAKIDEARDFNSFICIVNGWVRTGTDQYHPSRCFRYNFMCLNLYGTIEFRQAIGTVCAEDILRWVKTVTKFLMAAVRTPDYLFTEWAREGIPPVVLYVYGIPKVLQGRRGKALGERKKCRRKHALMK